MIKSSKAEPILCGMCFEEHHDIKIDDVDKYRWLELIKCEFCGSQPTIWFNYLQNEGEG